MSRFRHIVAATDGSPLATMAVERAAALAQALDAKLTILTVTEPMPVFDAAELGWSLPTDTLQQIRAADAERSRELLDTAAAKAREAGVKARILHVRERPPAEGIIEASRAEGADLIVMASHGRRGFNRLVLGSQASKVLAMSDIAVLVAKPASG